MADRTTNPAAQDQAAVAVSSMLQNSVEADVDANTDDGYETQSDLATSASLASSVRDYVFENNRRYHKYKEGSYLLPNDEPEQEREDMKHSMIVHLCGGKLHCAPISNPHKIIDLGTGTGIWAIDMGDEYPEAEVLGIDLSPVQPTWVPPNVRFYVDDVEAEWVDGPSLDYVHARHMCMTIKDWPRLLGQAYGCLKEGGWIELQELRLDVQCDDGTVPDDYGFGQFLRNLREGFSKFDIDLLGMERNQELVRDAGFVNIHEKIWKVPIGAWPKDKHMKMIGAYNRCVIYDGLQGICMAAYTRGLKWSKEEVETFLVGVRKSLMDSSIHSYYTFHALYGQKPFSNA